MEPIEIILILLLSILIVLVIYYGTKQSKMNQEKIAFSIQNRLENFSTDLSRLENSWQHSHSILRQELNSLLMENRSELLKSLRESSLVQYQQMEILTTKTNDSLEKVRLSVEGRLALIQQENKESLEQMRLTVDEKLQASVEKRFNESFKLISERLDMVAMGLGEMQTLATGVGDLKRVLSNVKTRGIMGEIQLHSILQQVLTLEQYDTNVIINPETNERVEYAIKLPGRGEPDSFVYLPIDAKFPVEDYQRLMDAYEQNQNIEFASKALENAVKKSAKDISSKYILPPLTTDFALLFVPIEGLYAEILRRPGLFETLQNEFKVTVVGPTNLVAFLSSLQMGFKTLVIEKRSAEVWELLGAIKSEFNRFGTILDRTKKKLQEATNVIDEAGTRSRVIERKLRQVETRPQQDIAEIPWETVDEE